MVSSYRKSRSQALITGIGRPIAWSLCLLLVLVLAYDRMPVLAFGWYGLLTLFIFPLAIFGLTRWDMDNRRWMYLALSPIALSIVLSIFTSAMFFADTYRDLLGTPAEKGAGLPNLNLEKAGLVSESMAHQAAQKLLSNQPSLGSQVQIGRMQKQLVNGKLVWVGFLEHPDFMRWLSNETTPGYVTVSAHDPTDSHLVTGLKMRYLDSGNLNDNIERHAWFSYPTIGLTDFSPELDETGRPFWVATVIKPIIPFGNDQVDGVVVIDPQTGESKRYDMAHVPEWVDRVLPQYLVQSQVAQWGSLVHGWWNAMTKKIDVLTISSAADLVYGDDGKAYWYVGLASTGSDNGINGYILVDSRTREAFHYTMAGAQEKVAIGAVQGLMPEKHYTATNPLPFMVYGEPTYVTILTDGTGIARAYGLMSIRNFQVVVAGDTLSNAARLYQSKLAREEGTTPQAVQAKMVTGSVLRFASDVRAGNATYYLTVPGADKIFMATGEVSDKLPLTREGDLVTIQFQETGQHMVPMTHFENKNL